MSFLSFVSRWTGFAEGGRGERVETGGMASAAFVKLNIVATPAGVTATRETVVARGAG